MSYGIDTIKIGFPVKPEQIDLIGWTRKEETTIKESKDILVKDYYMKYYETQNGTIITLKYIQNDYKGEIFNKLFIEFSLPNLINGCNHMDITDYESAFDIANTTIANIEGLPLLPDIREATLYRIDLYANFQVGRNVSDYILALGKAYRSRRKAMRYSDTGVLFKSTEISVSLYDKQKECKCNEAHGILRFEVSIRKKRKIEKYLGKKYAKLGTISFDLIHEHLQQELTMLSLDKPIPSDRSLVESMLSDAYKSKGRVLKLLGYWDIRQTLTREQMIEAGYTSRMIRYSEKLLADAGISVYGNQRSVTLPALSDLLLQEATSPQEVQILSPTPSDTRRFTYILQGDQHAKETRSRRRQHLQAQKRLVVCPNINSGKTGQQVFQEPT